MLETLRINKGESVLDPSTSFYHLINSNSDEYNDDLNEIIKVEISAVESYDKIVNTLTDRREVKIMEKLRNDHRNSIDYWKAQTENQDQICEETSDSWGVSVESSAGTKKMTDDKSTWMAIKKCEERGLSNYQKLLENGKLSSPQKLKIKDSFIPKQKMNIYNLDNLINIP